MKKVSKEGLKETLQLAWDQDPKRPVIIASEPGMNVESVIKDFWKGISGDRDLLAFHSLVSFTEIRALEAPEDISIFYSPDVSTWSRSALYGLSSEDGYRPPFWLRAVCQPNIQAVLFFDNCDWAAPIIKAGLYKLIFDRRIRDQSLSSEVMLLLGTDPKPTNFMIPPIVHRINKVLVSKSGEEE